jgi:hypothetical protein
MRITGAEVKRILQHRYPNAQIHVLDAAYDVPSRVEVERYYNKFLNRMAFARLTAWIKNVGDCDKWSWVLKAYVTLANWLRRDKNADPFGLLCYCVDGDKEKGHAINTAIWRHHGGTIIRELEPQPDGGIKSLTLKERESAWLVIV